MTCNAHLCGLVYECFKSISANANNAKEITKHINRKNELELASRAAAVGGTTGTGNLSRFTVLKDLVTEGKKLNDKGGSKKKGKVKNGSKR